MLIGTPIVEEYIVKLNKIDDSRGRKISIGRFKSKSRYRKITGHKQPLSTFEVVSISKKSKGTKVVEEKPAVKEEKELVAEKSS